ncbi:MAG TPA: DUF4139 domain-containing protein [Candidatus Mcinerneyibacterium sp.]|nr:DUF4139 domain-containing protein [Candidatus Mcinerneyibacterium sp.]
MKKYFVFFILLFVFFNVFAEGNLTVYNGNFALYNDSFELDLKKGVFDDYVLKKVPTKIDRGSILIFPQNYKNRIEILEQNYDYDLVNMNKLINKLLGSPVEFITKDGEKYNGKLVSSYGNNILIRENKNYISIDTDEIRKFKFTENSNLIMEPTLSWKIKSSISDEVDFEISYLMNDINWNSKYNLNLNEKENKGVLNSWIMLKNNSGKYFSDVNLQLMAGDVQKYIEKTRPKLYRDRVASVQRESVSQEKISEYYLYTINRPVSVKNNQNKEIPLFNPVEIDVTKKFTYQIQQNNKDVNVSIEFHNRKYNNLGIPLPAGVFSVYKKDKNGNTQFLGEDKIDHTPKNEIISVKIGNAFDVLGETNRKSRTKISDGVYRYTYEVTLTNRKDERVNVVAIFRRNSYLKFENSEIRVEDPDSNNLRFNLTLGSNEKKTFTFSLKTTY